MKDINHYVMSERFLSWERFFTFVVESVTKDTDMEYNKYKINRVYLQNNNIRLLIKVRPERIRPK